MPVHDVAVLYFLFALASFALNTFPIPANKYGRWFLGVLQFAVLNWDKAKDHFSSVPAAPAGQSPPNPEK